MTESIDDTLFQRIMHNPYTTCSLLGANFLTILDKGITIDNYNIISGQLRSRNFIYRMLFKDCYWLFLYFTCIAQMRSVISV